MLFRSKDCAPIYRPHECRSCDHQGHAPGDAPELFAGLSSGVTVDQSASSDLVGLTRVRTSAAPENDAGGEEPN